MSVEEMNDLRTLKLEVTPEEVAAKYAFFGRGRQSLDSHMRCATGSYNFMTQVEYNPEWDRLFRSSWDLGTCDGKKHVIQGERK